MSNKDRDMIKAPVDPDKNRPAELDELDFSDDESESFIDLSPESEADDDWQDDESQSPATPGGSPTLDDLSPETLIHEDGARSPHEPGEDTPTDKNLRIVTKDEIGAGYGLDEAELARRDAINNDKAQ
jgi:hypothetical protein